jgi:hypothetical protein
MLGNWHLGLGTWEKPSERKLVQQSIDALTRIYRDIDLHDFRIRFSFIMEKAGPPPFGGEAKILFSDADKGEDYRVDFMSAYGLCRVTARGIQYSAALEILTGIEYNVILTVRGPFITVVANGVHIISVQFGKISDGKIGLGTWNAHVEFTEPEVGPVAVKKCFVIMPFDEKRTFLYESVIVPALIGHPLFAFQYARADRLLTAGKITDEIAGHLRDADIILADVSEPNPNVYYELGFAHGASRRAILLRQATTDRSVEVPFDIKVFRIHVYEFSTQGFADLKTRLQNILSNELGPA